MNPVGRRRNRKAEIRVGITVLLMFSEPTRETGEALRADQRYLCRFKLTGVGESGQHLPVNRNTFHQIKLIFQSSLEVAVLL